MADNGDETERDRARSFVVRLVADADRMLGDRLLGAHMIGSLGHGGFNRRYSDIDVGLIVRVGLAQSELDGLRSAAASIDAACASRLSMFWSDETFALGRFPLLDRVDLLDHAVTVLERKQVRPQRPSIGEIRAYLAGAPFTGWAATVGRFARQEELDPQDRKPFLRALLYPARLVFSWRTGRMGSNDAAVEYLREAAPPALDVALIDAALACRRAAADPDPLFPRRIDLPTQVDACRRMMAETTPSL